MPATDDLGPARVLEKCGEALYGEGNWMSPIADDLRVPRRAIQNWLNGRNAIPAGVLGDVRALLLDERERLAALIDELDALSGG